MRPSALSRILPPLAASLAVLLVLAGAAFAALGDRTLREGSTGSDVTELQREVTYLGYPTAVTGEFTSRTESDIRNYEKTTGLTADGVVSKWEGGAIARRADEKRAREGSSSSRRYVFGDRVLSRGVKGSDVGTLQRLVTELGYSIPQTRYFGERTERRITRYERITGLRANGVVSISEQNTIERRVLAHRERSSSHVFPIKGSHSYGGSGSRFGAPRGGHSHGGQDLSASSGTPLVAVTGGRITQVRYQAGGGGYYVVLQGDDNYDYVYMHMRESGANYVSQGQRVRVGKQLGRVGSTGYSTGPHLHFEMWTAHWFDGGRRIDPLRYLQRWDAYS